ncbi:cation:proton antiporter domain-containing protein [Micromonospora sagamiensis]|uniref:CPA2 family monovalent cation:H+ antiporter-2 n=1 Tax=Micromonospora sagamiensis TaxID=47875 RepID=A0A562WMA6_9ACTN|nr:CPA2 family monovalent cation:H+ antiporter-2 [Micromonospora sagamiensis]BCL15952.1 potassium transporter KefB [Micromonospora sagamiensis]
MQQLLASEAGGGPPAFLAEIVALMLAAAVIGYLSTRLRIVPIVGFLLAGVAIGPHALGLVRSQQAVDVAAEVGVILLLFTIGIEFSLGRLAAMWRLIVIGGGLQVLLTVGVAVGALALFGVSWQVGVFTGFLVSLSSTAIVLRLLASRGETQSATGRTALAYLIFQDLAIVVMVLVVPMLGDGGGSALDIATALGTAVAVVALVLVVARWVMPRLLETVARACSPEVFLLAVIAICFGTAYLTSLAGVSVSLGAFLAGMVVSESRHSEHALGEILPLQILFSATFFVSVGMLLDLGFLATNLPLVLAAVLGVVLVKGLATAVSAVVLRVRPAVVVALSLLIVQVGEFSFVLEKVGREAGLTPAGLGEDGTQAFIAATVLLMVATPWLGSGGRRLGMAVERHGGPAPARPAPAEAPDAASGPQDHVVISGYGAATRALAAELAAADVPLVVVTLNPDGAAEAEADGHRVLRGDSTRRHILDQAGVVAARVVVIPEDEPEDARRIASVVRTLSPEARIVVRFDTATDLAELVAAGIDTVVRNDRAGNTSLSRTVLDALPGAANRFAAAEARRPGRTRVDVDRIVTFRPDPETACPHTSTIQPVLPSAPGCEDCLRAGTSWVHLRTCLTCGHVGCCDSSPERHASRHQQDQDHPIMASAEPGEEWAYCYLDETLLPPAAGPR